MYSILLLNNFYKQIISAPKGFLRKLTPKQSQVENIHAVMHIIYWETHCFKYAMNTVDRYLILSLVPSPKVNKVTSVFISIIYSNFCHLSVSLPKLLIDILRLSRWIFLFVLVTSCSVCYVFRIRKGPFENSPEQESPTDHFKVDISVA